MQATPENQGQFETRVAQLTRTQKQVLEMFVQSCDDGAIAASLEIVDNTVRQHISHIASKLGIPSDRSDKGFRRREIVQLFRRFAPEQVVSPHYIDDPLSNSTREQLTSATPETLSIAEVEAVEPLGRNDPNFVGREEAIATLDAFREQGSKGQGSKLLQIVAAEGQGKMTLARKYLQSRFPQVIEFAIPKEVTNLTSVEELLSEKLSQLGEAPGQTLIISLERLKQRLQSTQVGILIDNLEPVLDAKGRFVEQHRDYVELLRTLNSSNIRSFTIITSREFLSEPSISPNYYSLKPLSLDDWKVYFDQRQIHIQDNLLEQIYDACFGMAKAMEIFAAKEEPLDIYWQKIFGEPFVYEPDLKHLALDSIHEIFGKNPDLIRLISTYGKNINLNKAQDFFANEEKELWLQLERYSLGEWSNTDKEFKVYDFFYEKIIELLEFESKSVDFLTGNEVQCQIQNKNCSQDLFFTLSTINENTSSNKDRDDWLLPNIYNENILDTNKQLIDENITLGSSSSDFNQEEADKSIDSVNFNQLNQNILDQNLIFPNEFDNL